MSGRLSGRQPTVRRFLTWLAGRFLAPGGIRNLLGKVVALHRREGIAGFVRAFREVRDRLTLYDRWCRHFDPSAPGNRAALAARLNALTRKPLISVVMPVFNPRSEWLGQAIESVLGQFYGKWELCIADDASTDPAVRAILERYAGSDTRIKITFRERNGHISAASNSALALATGEWIALLDHDDLLAADALAWVADAATRWPEVQMIYSDEDKIDARNHRSDPYFKCEWNRELFEAQNMFSHLGVYRRDLIARVGGFREGFEGAQDYDLALRCMEVASERGIRHIPRILYHWRVHSASTAQRLGSKPYALEAGQRALAEHFAREGVEASVEVCGSGYRVRHALPAVPPLVTLIVPTRNGEGRLRTCIESIRRKTAYPNYEILIVDNGSDAPGCLAYLRAVLADPRVRVIHDPRPFNYAALNNNAVRHARGDLVGLVNDDIEVITPDWLGEMVSHAVRPGIGAVGAKLLYPDGTVQHAGVVLGLGGVASHAHRGLHRSAGGYFERANLLQAFSAVTAACLVVGKAKYELVGGLNEADLAVAYNDVDFCLKLREAGYRNVWTPYAELYHYESASRGADDTPAKRARFAKETEYMWRRWGRLVENDPAYNPNLSLKHADFRIAWPPRQATLDYAGAGVGP